MAKKTSPPPEVPEVPDDLTDIECTAENNLYVEWGEDRSPLDHECLEMVAELRRLRPIAKAAEKLRPFLREPLRGTEEFKAILSLKRAFTNSQKLKRDKAIADRDAALLLHVKALKKAKRCAKVFGLGQKRSDPTHATACTLPKGHVGDCSGFRNWVL
jgi:hypothetical protein